MIFPRLITASGLTTGTIADPKLPKNGKVPAFKVITPPTSLVKIA